MDLSWRRIVGTIVLTVVLGILLFRGVLRDEIISGGILLGGVLILAVIAYGFWPALDTLWSLKSPWTLTWRRAIVLAIAGLVLSITIVLTGRVFDLMLDPWLVLAGIAVATFLAGLTWQDSTLRWRSRGPI